MLADLIARRAAKKASLAEKKAAMFADVANNGSRRSFLRGFGTAAAGAAAVSAFGGGTGINRAQAAVTDADVLNFALNLEYLEAEFYYRAAFGHGLDAANTGPSAGTVLGGSQVPFSSTLIAAYAQEIAMEEKKHVLFLRSALGASAVSRPQLDLQNSFITLGQASGVSQSFNPFADDFSFLLGAYIFEDVGVTAYHGAATLITTPAYLDAAAGILAVEAYHAGLVRTILFANNYSSQTSLISNLRATLDGTVNTANLDDQGVGTLQTPRIVLASAYVNGASDNNAIAYDRTTKQVLKIVYGNINATPGLFFPNGLNGNIK